MTVVTPDDFFMADRKSPQLTLTLSQKAYDELTKVADWKGITLATLIRYIVEREHESSEFASLLERASIPEKTVTPEKVPITEKASTSKKAPTPKRAISPKK